MSASSPTSVSSSCTRKAPAPGSRSTRRAASACPTPPTPSWACSPRARAARRTCRPTSPSALWSPATGPRSAASTREGIATGIATFETTVPTRASLDAKWLPGHRWVAEIDGEVVGWTALSPVSTRECYAGVAESSIYVADGYRGRGIGKALIRQQVVAADEAGLWTLQTAIFTENRASIALHHQAGYRTVGIRERIAQLNGTWHDTVLIERRTDTVTRPGC